MREVGFWTEKSYGVELRRRVGCTGLHGTGLGLAAGASSEGLMAAITCFFPSARSVH